MDYLEEEDSLLKLLAFVEMSRALCSENIVDAKERYIQESFEPDLGGLCFCHYEDVAQRAVANNSFSESYNSLQYRVGNIKSNKKLHVSGGKLLKLSDKRFSYLQVRIEMQERTTKIAKAGMLVDDVEAQLSRKIVIYICVTSQ